MLCLTFIALGHIDNFNLKNLEELSLELYLNYIRQLIDEFNLFISKSIKLN